MGGGRDMTLNFFYSFKKIQIKIKRERKWV